MLHTSEKIAGFVLRHVHEVGCHATPGALEQAPECNAQRVGHAQGVYNSARPRVGAACARGSLGPNRQLGHASGVALKHAARVLGGANPRVGDLPAACKAGGLARMLVLRYEFHSTVKHAHARNGPLGADCVALNRVVHAHGVDPSACARAPTDCNARFGQTDGNARGPHRSPPVTLTRGSMAGRAFCNHTLSHTHSFCHIAPPAHTL